MLLSIPTCPRLFISVVRIASYRRRSLGLPYRLFFFCRRRIGFTQDVG